MSSSSQTDAYQVIARKYRPQTFADVIGQDAIVTTLKNALKNNRIAHGYLFCGCRGTGKTTLARIFAKALNCQNLSALCEPCGSCNSCIEIAESRSLDVIEIDGASHRGIDDIRQINETIGYAPSSGKYKIYIIDEVHMLTKEAFNALLKTLEEPPSNVKFFFATTEPHKVLQTIMSRCQRFDLSRICSSLVKEKLHKIARDLSTEVEDDAVELVARLSEGSMRDAESLFDQILCYNEGTLTAEKVAASLGIAPSSTFFELDKAVEEADLSFAFVLAEKIFSSGKDLSFFLDSLMEHFRTILTVQLGQNDGRHTGFSLKKYRESAQNIYSQQETLYILDYLLSSIQQVGKSSFKRIHLEMILLHIIRSKKKITIDVLVRRLEELQKKGLQAASDVQTVEATKALSTKEKDSKETTASATDKAQVKEERAPPSAQPIMEKVEAVEPPLAPTAATPKIEPKETATQEVAKVIKPQSRHETVIRFAAVELEGVFSKK